MGWARSESIISYESHRPTVFRINQLPMKLRLSTSSCIYFRYWATLGQCNQRVSERTKLPQNTPKVHVPLGLHCSAALPRFSFFFKSLSLLASRTYQQPKLSPCGWEVKRPLCRVPGPRQFSPNDPVVHRSELAIRQYEQLPL